MLQNIFVKSESGAVQVLTTLTTRKHPSNTSRAELFSSSFAHLKDQELACSPHGEQYFAKDHLKKFFSEASLHGAVSIQRQARPPPRLASMLNGARFSDEEVAAAPARLLHETEQETRKALDSSE